MSPEVPDEADGVSRCTEDDLGELRAFQAHMYEAGSRVLDHSRADWLFSRHPLRPDEGLTIWVCRRGGQIVGTEAGIPFDLTVEDGRCRGSWAVELMVDPEWRGSGIGPALSEAHRRSCLVSAGLSVSHAAYRSLLRRRSTDMGRVPMYLRLLDPRAILRWEGAPMLVRYLALPLIAPALWLLGGVDRIRNARTDLLSISAFDQRADVLWQEVSVLYRAISHRDAPWLRWRFDDCPHRSEYLRYYVLHRERLIGYLVLRWTTWSGRPVLALVDYLAAPGDVARLLSSSLRVARALGATAVLCNTLNVQAENAFRTSGFFQRRNQGIRFLAYTSDESLKPVILNPSDWFITSADSDLD
ncbi:MAG TPA: GNAT family N-acetyltransferase [Acidimicrobiales bacterium]|nr:GNAT family N-acetyltransferase [Acidimicrobiales bacterium]HVA02191.1 GNAT family N-acetyltransferase [Acidimicrobiales bacterium]